MGNGENGMKAITKVDKCRTIYFAQILEKTKISEVKTIDTM
jgi:hypothetical protein